MTPATPPPFGSARSTAWPSPAPGPADTDAEPPPTLDAEDWRRLQARLLTALRDAVDGRQAAEMALSRQHTQLAVTAHELRNPLAPMASAVHLLKALQTTDPMAARAHAVLERQLAQLSALVDDLLDVSRLATGKLRLHRRLVALGPLIEDAMEVVAPGLRRRDQRLVLDLPAAPLWVDGDPVRLVQVLCNLLDNASKYTPDGGALRLEARCDGRQTTLTVADSGIGIDATQLQRVFEPYVQDPSAQALNDDGLGIGLMLVRQLVQAHGGEVVAHSDGRHHGSRFVVTLPAATPDAVTAA